MFRLVPTNCPGPERSHRAVGLFQKGIELTVQKTSRTKGSTKAEQRAEMTEQILDAAEFLFSRHGLYGVTLKDVAKHVGVHHTLLNYYFRDKRKLFDAVCARRAVVRFRRRAFAAFSARASLGFT